MKKCYEPINLSHRNSTTPSLNSDRSCSSSENAATATNHSGSLQDASEPSREQRDIKTPDFAFLEALALRSILSNPSAIDHQAAADTLNKKQKAYGNENTPRPFQAYPKERLMFPFPDNANTAEKFRQFRLEALKRIADSRGGEIIKSNPKMRRTKNSAASDNNENNLNSSNVRDSAYLTLREKNNAAAKKSRDRRKMKEEEVTIKASFLEKENLECKAQLSATRHELTVAYHQMESLRKELALAQNRLATCCCKGLSVRQ